MTERPSSKYQYHIQSGHVEKNNGQNGNKLQPDPNPHDIFRKYLNRFVGALALMAVFLAAAYFVAVATWEWRNRRFTKGASEAEPAEPTQEQPSPSSVSNRNIPMRMPPNEEALHKAELLEREADAQIEAGQINQAITAYTQALSAWPDLAAVYPKLGRAYLRTRSYNRARFALEKATQLYPSEPALFNDLGVAFLQLGRFDRARVQFDAALALDSDYAPAHFNNSLCRRAMGDDIGSQRALDRFLQLRPEDPRGLKEKAYFLAARREYAGALELLNRAIANAPTWAPLYFDAAATAALMNDAAAAVRFLSEAENLSSAAAAYLALQQPAFSKIRSNEVVQAYVRDVLQRAKSAAEVPPRFYRPGTPEPMLSFEQAPPP